MTDFDLASIDWIVFALFVLILLAADVILTRKHPGKIPVKTAAVQTAFCIGMSLIFAVWVLASRGIEPSADYLAAYITEESMSVDNLFVFIVVFAAFAIPEEYRHKVLFLGVYGAIVFRALFVILGAEILTRFEVAIYIFGVLLVILAFKTAFGKSEEGRLALWLSRRMRMSPDCAGGRFFTDIDGKTIMTPMMACVIAIELTDILFAIDSVPACLGITTDIFIVYSSNIFAILGLRSLFFILNESVSSLRYMKFGLAAILGFVGFKMLVSGLFDIGSFESLAAIVGIVAVTVAASKIADRKYAEIPKQD